MLNREDRLEQEVAEKRRFIEEYAAEKKELMERLELIVATIKAPLIGEQDDVAAFGRDAIVYCRQHMRPHGTGWCGVSPHDKVALGVTDMEKALQKCQDWGFEIADPNRW